jgi:hypothetical protein
MRSALLSGVAVSVPLWRTGQPAEVGMLIERPLFVSDCMPITVDDPGQTGMGRISPS